MRRHPRILVVGARAAFSHLLDCLEEEERYQFEYAPALASAALEPLPDAILLHVPEDAAAAAQALAELADWKKQVPVVVMSTTAEMDLYLASMTHGAFDYFTCYTPLNEVGRLLANAVRWHARRAA